MSNLNNVLEDIWRDGYNAGSYNARRREKAQTNFSEKQTTASQIEKDLLALVGPDTTEEQLIPELRGTPAGEAFKTSRNSLRAELRTAIRSYCNGGSDE